MSARLDRNLLGWMTGLGLVACVAWLYLDALPFLWQTFQRPEYSHGFLIPIISAYVVWQRWPAVLRDRSAGAWSGVALLAGGLGLLLVSGLTLMETPRALALLPIVAGLALAALGWRAMRHLWVPLLFLAFALPLPATVYLKLSLHLQLISSEFGASLLRLAGVPVFVGGNVIDLGVYQLQVAEACSGLRYLFPLSAFSFLCAWLYRGPFWTRAVIFASAAPITVVMNSVRIALTGLLIEHGNIALAEGFLHYFEGWVIFVTALLLLFGLMWLLARLRGQPAAVGELLDFDRVARREQPDPRGAERRTQRPAGPLAACCAVLAVMVALTAALPEPRRTIPDRPGLVTFPLHLEAWRGTPGTPDPAALDLLRTDGLDDYLTADFSLPGSLAPVNLWVAYYGSLQSVGAAIHSPEICLPGGGWEFLSFDRIPAPGAGAFESGFTINRALIGNGHNRLLLYYWYEERGRQYASELWSKIYIVLDMVASGRSDGALVRLLTPIEPHETIAEAEGRLADFFAASYPQLKAHVGA